MNRKICIEHSVESICIYKHGNETSNNMLGVNVGKTSCMSSNYRFMRLICREDNPNKETLIYIPYTPCHHHLNSYNLSCPQINRTRVCI